MVVNPRKTFVATSPDLRPYCPRPLGRLCARIGQLRVVVTRRPYRTPIRSLPVGAGTERLPFLWGITERKPDAQKFLVCYQDL